ncbi:hypothetical protein PRIPAC_79758 [Pristionchus pacificus]|uniref:Enoyl-[acyl-carrier-protein] reductase, mitochondrial n=1 Tax=Pristionchus pacificus TaxID=54126 RepID=A0A2A6CAY5_PRIPA|nr:hypothetical protein PRIPAC_79758 [Pristionchus pacificus]|eukprot:PDM75385.1 hypothetical protein PRIPAC_42562 [Pristionchus pacificus]
MQRRAIKYSKFGDPRQVAELVTETISAELEPNEALVRWLASPINPLDINKLQGAYAFKPPLPAIGGSEAVGRVIGSSVTKLSPGDKVVIFTVNSSCWTDLSVIQGATLMINPTTAWIMMRMGGMEKGDWLIQNSANSGVGRAVIEIAREKGYHTINIVRDRPQIRELKNELIRMGGDIVWTEEEVRTEGKNFKGRPKLALNGVGGKSCLQISSLLSRGGMLVTYGGMSKKAHEISTSSLVFNGITAVGVANALWMANHEEETKIMLSEIQEFYVRGALHSPPMEEHPLENYKKAIENSMDGKHAKQIFIIDDEKSSKI